MGFVEEQQLGPGKEEPGEIGSLAHSMRAIAGEAVGRACQTYGLQDLTYFTGTVTGYSGNKVEVLSKSEVVAEGWQMPRETDARADQFEAGGFEGGAENRAAAGAGLEERRHHPEQGGLPRAIGTLDAEALT